MAVFTPLIEKGGKIMEPTKLTLTETIRVLFENKKYNTLRDILQTMNPIDIAAVFSALQDEKIAILFRILPKESPSRLFTDFCQKSLRLKLL